MTTYIAFMVAGRKYAIPGKMHHTHDAGLKYSKCIPIYDILIFFENLSP